jgi:hypothetical protein
VYEWQRGTMTRLTFDGGHFYPVWSPDGRYIAFEAAGGIFSTRTDGAGKPQPLIQSRNAQIRGPSRPMASCWRFQDTILKPERTSGPCLWRGMARGCGLGSRRCSCKHPTTSGIPLLSRRAVARLQFRRVRKLPGVRPGVPRYGWEVADFRTTEVTTRCGQDASYLRVLG